MTEGLIYYLGHYNDPSVTLQNRTVSLAAVTKMDYIAEVLNRIGNDVSFISMAIPVVGECGKSGVFQICDGQELTLFPAWKRGNKVKGFINRVRMHSAVESFLDTLDETDTVICYHSLEFCGLLERAKERNRFTLILEVEEFYCDVSGKESDRLRENRVFESADGFIFPTELLAKSINTRGKPFVVCSGIYKNARIRTSKFADGLIHVVYAGTLDPRKGGAAAAAAAGALLDSRFHLHVLGGGAQQEIEALTDAVRLANESGKGCLVSYEGQKQGEDFTCFVQSCHIGLSPQNPDAAFNKTSFPSKVFMYLSNGLRVVSVDLPVFTDEVRDSLVLCKTNSAEDLATAIMSVDDCEQSCGLLTRLDEEFGFSLSNMLDTIKGR